MLSAAREALRERLTAAGIETLVHYPLPIPQQPAVADAEPAACPVADRVCAQVWSLPLYPSLSPDADHACRGRAARVSMRGRAPRVLLFAGILLVQFVIFEFALRRWGSSEAAPAFQGLFTGDDRIGYRLQPNARAHFATAEFETDIAINNVGVRDSEDLPPKAPGERRVLILGDSLVLSVQVPFDQTFGELLEAQLNASLASARYRVINAGVQGYGPVEQLLFFRRIVDQVQPDIVLATVFVGNDAEEAVVSEPKLSGKRDSAEALRESFVTSLRRTVRRSMVLQLLRLRVVTATDRFQFKAPPEPPLQSYAAQPHPVSPAGSRLRAPACNNFASKRNSAARGWRSC